MDVNKEARVETKKRNLWFLNYNSDFSGQLYEHTMKGYMGKPTVIDLALYFQKVQENGGEIPYTCVISALVFLDHLVDGGGRRGDEANWWTLQEVTES